MEGLTEEVRFNNRQNEIIEMSQQRPIHDTYTELKLSGTSDDMQYTDGQNCDVTWAPTTNSSPQTIDSSGYLISTDELREAVYLKSVSHEKPVLCNSKEPPGPNNEYLTMISDDAAEKNDYHEIEADDIKTN